MRPAQTTLITAPLLLRLSAVLIDMAIMTVVGLALIAVTSDSEALSDPEKLDQAVFALLVSTGAIYHIGFLSTMSATPGKLAMGIYVADRQGARIRPDTAILRYIVFLAGNFILIGFAASLVLLFVDTQRRTVHDRVAGTLVLRRPQDSEAPPPDLS